MIQAIVAWVLSAFFLCCEPNSLLAQVSVWSVAVLLSIVDAVMASQDSHGVLSQQDENVLEANRLVAEDIAKKQAEYERMLEIKANKLCTKHLLGKITKFEIYEKTIDGKN